MTFRRILVRAVFMLCALGLLVFWWRSQSPTHATRTAEAVARAGSAVRAARTAPLVATAVREPPPAALSPVLASPGSSLGQFQSWSQRYLAATPAARAALVAEGVQLAVARRAEFKALIVGDPREALRQAVPVVARQQLPAEIVALLEDRVEGRAQLRVYLSAPPADGSPATQPPVLRIAEFGDRLNYVAHVFGRREASIAWLPNAALNGVALDQHLAVAESPLRRLEIGEIPSAAKSAVELCPISGKTTLATPPTVAIAEETVAVEIYGEIVYLCDGSHVTFFEEQLIQAEGATGGPQRFTGLMPARPSPSLGELRVLYIPMTFADQNQIPATEAKSYEVMRDVADFFYKSSFGRLSVQAAVTPPVKLPHNEAWYVQKDTSDGVSKEIDGLSLELQHAREEAAKLGFDANDYDAVVLRLAGGPRSGVGGYGGGTSVWVYSDSVSIVAHELGHCFGLAHANFWDTGGASAIGAGANQEYGSPFDKMGSGPFPQGQFNAQAKNQVKWLPDNFVQTVTADGVYRIHAADQTLLDPTRRYALRIVKDNQRAYWGEVRAQFDSLNRWVANGLILGWKWPLNSGSNIQVIDTTPQSPGGKNDAPIVVGQSFSDLESGIHLTVLAVNTDANGARSVDVGVVFGVFPGNIAPTLALTASAFNVPANAPVTFSAAAADRDGDSLSYQWLSSDNSSASAATIAANSATFTRSFATDGQYVVTCVVSDGRGGRALRSALVVIGAGNSRFAISGRVTLVGQGLAGVYVSTGTGNAVPTDSFGYYTIPNLDAGTYTVAPLLYGYEFTDLFNNSVLVGPSYNGANFAAAALPSVSLTASTPVANEAGTVAAKFTLSRTGPEAEALTVSLVPAFGTATVTTDYKFSPAVTAGSPYNTVTIPADASTLDLVVTPVNDTAAEGPETVSLQLGLSSFYVIAGNPAATVTILDDDTTLPRISITSAAIAARESPARPASFTVARTGATTASLTVSLAAAGTAAAGSDYTALPATVTIPVGAASFQVPVAPLDDALAEDFETVLVVLASNVAYLIDPTAASASIIIEDDDQQVVSLAATDARATEVNLALPGAVPDPAVFVVTRTGDISQALTVYYALAGTALHGMDFEALPGSVTFPAGAPRVSVVITPRFDGLGEGPETVLLQLAAGGPGYRLGPVSNGSISISDAGDPVYVDVVAMVGAREPATNGRFRFSLKGMPETASSLIINYTLAGTATPGTDYATPSGSLTVYSGATAIAAGQYHSLFLRTDGSLWSTGYNNNGQLGDGTTTSRSTPVLVAAGVDTMAGGFYHTLFVKTDGSLWSVGANGNGQLGDTTTTNRSTPFQILATGVKSVAAGANFSLFVKTDGSLWGMGQNSSGQLGDGTTTQRTAPVQVLASGVRAVAAGHYHSLIHKTDGSLWAAGNNVYGQLGDGSNTARSSPVQIVASGVSAIAAGEYHSLFLKTDGSLWVVGRNDTGQLGDGTTVNRSMPFALATGVAAIAGGQKHSLFVKTDGTLWAMGYNNHGQLGDGTTVNRLAPVAMTSGVTAAAGGGLHTLILRAGGALAGTGYNPDGELGLGNTTNTTTLASVTTTLADLAIVPINDTLAEDLETITVTISPSASYTTWEATRSATMWLHDDEQPTVFVDAHSGTASNGIATLAENGTSGKFYLSRTGSTAAALTVNYTLGGTATNGTDYATLSGVAVIPAGVPGVDVTVTPIQDTAFEGTETLVLTLAAGAYARSPGATLYLTDDETSTTTVAFSTAGSVVAESAGVVNVPVTLSAAAAAPVTVDYAITTPGTATSISSDFTTSLPYWVRLARVGSVVTAALSTNGTTWTAYTAPATITAVDPVLLGLVVCGQDGTLASATFDNVTLIPGPLGTLEGRDLGFIALAGSMSVSGGVYTVSGAGTSLGGSADSGYFAAQPVSGDFTFTARVVTSTGTGTNRYAGVMVREDMRNVARSVAVVQRGTTATYRFARTAAVLTTLGAGVDYRFTPGSLTFAPGVTSLSIPVNVVDDLLSEPLERVVVVLRNPNGAQLGATAQHVISVTDNDVAPLQPSVGFAAASGLVSEGGVPAVLVAVSQTSASPISVAYAATSGTATAGADFSLPSGTLTFAPGELTKALPLSLIDDAAVEPNETVVITLSQPVGATLTSLATHTLTLADNDLPVVSVAATDGAASENGDTGQWTFTRTGSTAAALTANFTVGGTATSGTDYTALGSSLTIPAGAATATLALAPLADALNETSETVVLTLAPAGGYLFDAPGTATITLADTNTPVVTIVASDADASETGPNTGVFTFARTGATTGALTVSFTVTGTATSGSDYTAIGTSVTIPAGQSSATVAVTPLDDAITEGPEYVVVSLATNAAYALGTATFGNVTIADNDNPPAVVVASPTGKAVQLAAGVGLLLAASATDDGAPNPLTYTWSKFSGPGMVTFGSANSAGTTAQFAGNGLYIVRISVTDGQFTVSDDVTVQVGGFAAANWIDASLGAPSTRGGFGEINGVFTVNGSGTGFNATTDSGHFVSRPVEGTSSVVARVAGLAAGASANALAGVMMRETNFRGARRAVLTIKSNGAVEWHKRSAVSGANTLFSGGTAAFPAWLKIERTGDVLTAFRATDTAGSPGAWTQVGSPLTLATLTGTINAGIAASNATVNTIVAATFDQVALAPAPAGPALVTENLGAGALTGTVSQSGSVYTIVGSGTLGDGGTARFQQFSGDVVVTARVLSRTGTGIFPPAQSGVLIRDTSLDSSAFGTMSMSTSWGGYFVWRNVIGGSSAANYGGGNAYPYWVRLVREGDTLTAWKAVNAAGNVPGPWVRQGATQIFSAGAPIYVGLTADLGASPVANTVTMDSYSVAPGNLAPVVSPGTGGTFPTALVALTGTVSDDGQPTPPGAVTTLWSRVSGPGTVTFGNASLVETTALFSGSGTYVLRLTADDGEVRVFAESTYVISAGAPPTIATAPTSQQIGAGGAVTLTVVAGGVGPFTYQWQKDGVNIGGATAASYALTAVQVSRAGSYTVVVGNSGGSATSSAAVVGVVPAGTGAAHQVVAVGYVGSTQLTLAHTLTYAGTATALDWEMVLPAGWSFASETGSGAQGKPAVGIQNLLTWSWTTIPASPLTFRVVVSVPAGRSGSQQVVSLVNLVLGGPALRLLAQADPLVIVVGAARHGADTDASGRISIVELTRVIELYNVRNGTVRTGAYRLNAATEDGFDSDPARSGTAAFTPYHTADTNGNGLLGLIELTRVIELYNVRAGTARTGAYHLQADTEDGFAPGP